MSNRSPEHMRVLIADDNPDALRILRRYLTDAGVAERNITAVGTGSEALCELDTRPDLVIADLTMPHVPGSIVVRHARLLGIEAHLVTSHRPMSKSDSDMAEPKRDLKDLVPGWVGAKARGGRNATAPGDRGVPPRPADRPRRSKAREGALRIARPPSALAAWLWSVVSAINHR